MMTATAQTLDKLGLITAANKRSREICIELAACKQRLAALGRFAWTEHIEEQNAVVRERIQELEEEHAEIASLLS